MEKTPCWAEMGKQNFNQKSMGETCLVIKISQAHFESNLITHAWHRNLISAKLIDIPIALAFCRLEMHYLGRSTQSPYTMPLT